MKEDTLTLKNDLVFKIFFGKKGNEKYLKSFLESLLNIKIEEIEIMQEATLQQLKRKEKTGRLDIKATIDKNKIINIEMQVEDEHNMEKRTLYYGAKLIAEQLEKGERYEELKETVLINILNFNLLKVPEYHTETVIVAKEHRNYEVLKDLKYHFIELPKFRKAKPELSSMLECWIAFIDGTKGELIEMAKRKEPIIKEAKEELEEILSEGVLKEIAEYEDSAKHERASYIAHAEERGRKIGEKNGRKNTAKKLLKMGMKIEDIMEATELSKEEIEELK